MYVTGVTDAHVWYSTRGFDPNRIGVPWPYRGSDQVAIGIDVGG